MLCISGFADDVMFPYNGRNRPESTTTRIFRPVRQVATPGAKSVVSDCILFYMLLVHVSILERKRLEGYLSTFSVISGNH